MSQTVKAAVILAAGSGTRMEPATLAIPKVLLPLGVTPVLDVLVKEAVRVGLASIYIVVNSEWEIRVRDYVAKRWESWQTYGELAGIKVIGINGRSQPEFLGSGGALLATQAHFFGNEPFVVMYCDDVLAPTAGMLSDLQVMIAGYKKLRHPIIATRICPTVEMGNYGCVETTFGENGLCPVKSLVEKPRSGTARSNQALIGRFVLPPSIFDLIKQERAKNPDGRETPLTDAIRASIPTGVHAWVLEQPHFDIGNRTGYNTAFTALG